MKIIDLRKYIFANITAFIGYIPICIIVDYNSRPHQPIQRGDLVSDAYFTGVLIGICIQTVLFTMVLTLIEILIRKFFIEKKFPDFKINIKFNLPKYLYNILNTVYTILFYFGIFISSLLFIAAILIIIE